MVNIMKRNWLKGLVAILTLTMAVSMAAPMPAQAASKSLTVKVTAPKKGVKLYGTKLKLHTKKAVQLKVTYKGKTVTTKVKYKSTNPAVVSVTKKGRMAVKKNGNATVTIRYKGITKNLRVVVSGHDWKAHKKTKMVWKLVYHCNCGAILPPPEKKYCAKCAQYPRLAKQGLCVCKREAHLTNHILNNEPDNYWSGYELVKVKYIDFYHCDCGARKAGEPEPKDER